MTGPLAWRDRADGGIEVAFTDASTTVERFADTPQVQVDAALAQLSNACGARVVDMHQVHGASVSLVVDAAAETTAEADALVTAVPGVALLARVADCVPVLIADPAAGVIAAVHSGRPGLLAGVVPAALRAMTSLGAAPAVAWIGPHVCGRCYEVPDPMRREVVEQVPASWSETSWGTPALDLGAGVAAQLARGGVEDVREVGGCTREDSRWHSYRRDGAAAGRFAGLIWRESR
ncbi:MAG: polyphenol oxidase family protein [Nocardioides sp.]